MAFTFNRGHTDSERVLIARYLAWIASEIKRFDNGEPMVLEVIDLEIFEATESEWVPEDIRDVTLYRAEHWARLGHIKPVTP